MFVLLVVAFLLSGLFYRNQAAHAHFVTPKKGDACPICGMSVSEHPIWVAVIMFSDGKHVKLHGPKSMFTYYFNLDKLSKIKKKQQADIIVARKEVHRKLKQYRRQWDEHIIDQHFCSS